MCGSAWAGVGQGRAGETFRPSTDMVVAIERGEVPRENEVVHEKLLKGERRQAGRE